jgi:hypothetical protein
VTEGTRGGTEIKQSASKSGRRHNRFGSYRIIGWPLHIKLNAQGHARERLLCWGANSLRTCHRDSSGAGYRFSAVEEGRASVVS